MQLIAQMDRVDALTAAGANSGIKRFADGIVKKHEGFLPPADTGPAKQFDRRRADQQGAAELELDFDTVFFKSKPLKQRSKTACD